MERFWCGCSSYGCSQLHGDVLADDAGHRRRLGRIRLGGDHMDLKTRIEQLPLEDQIVLSLVYVEELTPPQVAYVLDVTLPEAIRKITDARVKLGWIDD